MPVYGPNLDIVSNGLWDFPLIVELSEDTKGQYTPKSDASLRINKFPHLVLEIISIDSQSDCNRMLLQAACLARLGNALRVDKAGPFIVSAIYINDELCAKWYFVYQPLTSRQVEYVDEEFDLKDAKTMFEFVFRLYNIVSLANDDNKTLRKPFDTVTKLHSFVTKLRYPTLTKLKLKRKTREDDGAGNRSSKKPRNEGGPVDNNILSDVALLEALERDGYTIPEEVESVKLLFPVRVSFA
jgi:hypothetical protein